MNLPAVRANELLDQMGIHTLPVIPSNLCEKLDIEYREQPFDGFDGKLLLANNRAMISVNSRIANEGRKNYTAGHELGHYCLHAASAPSFECTRHDTNGISATPMEQEANEFASELLMPKSLVMPRIQRDLVTWGLINDLKVMCQTSLTAAAMRYVDLAEVECAFVISQEGQIKFHRRSPSFRFRVDMDSRLLVKGTVAHLAMSGEKTIDDFESVSAGLWLSGKFTAQSQILEWSLPLNGYRQILTLLLDEGDVCYAKDGRGPRSSDYEEDDEDGLGVDKYMKEVIPFKKSRRR